MPGWGIIRGVVGHIDWGHIDSAYYHAAALNGYKVTRSPRGAWQLRGLVVMADAFKLRQQPLWFVAPHARGAWRWPIRSLEFETSQGPTHLVATLGPPEP
jgi:hypothetical protein